ncbi:unnamed protein product [Closterium sp. Naga37s-1]|nr:unnamed protein product [Closterium sp. Naga37s-1]
MGQSHRNSGITPSLAHLSNSCPRILVLAPDSTLHHLTLDARQGGNGGEGGRGGESTKGKAGGETGGGGVETRQGVEQGREKKGEYGGESVREGDWVASEQASEEPEQAGNGLGSCSSALPSLSPPGAPLCPCLPSPSRRDLLPVAARQEQQLCVMIPVQPLRYKGESRPATDGSRKSSNSSSKGSGSSSSSGSKDSGSGSSSSRSSRSVSDNQNDKAATSRSERSRQDSESIHSSSSSSSSSRSGSSSSSGSNSGTSSSSSRKGGGGEEQGPNSEVKRTLDMFLSAAVRLVMQGEHDKALEIFDKVLEQKVFTDHALTYRGTVYALMHRYQEAIADFTKALEFNPAFYEARRRRGQTYTGMGKNDEAVKDLTAVIEARPTDWPAYMERGIAHFNARLIFQALSDLRTVTKHEPKNAQALFFLAQAHMHGGECAAAIPLLHRVKQLNPNLKGLLVQLGQAYKEESRLEEAEETYRQALEKEPQNLLGYHLYSNLKHGMGYHREAMEIARKGLRLADANDLDLRYMEASCLHALGYFPQAIQAYSAILALQLAPGVDQTKQFQAFYQRELTAYLAQRRGKPVTAYSIDDDIHPTFKELWAKRIAYAPLFPGYQLQPLRTALKLTAPETGGHNVRFSEGVRRVLGAADELGKRTQYWCNGFLRNRRQHRMAGLAILDVRDMVRETWKRMRQERGGGSGGEGGEGGLGRVGEGGSGGGSGEEGGSGKGRQRGKRRQQRQQQLQQQEQQEEGQKAEQEQEQEQGRAGRKRGAAGYVRRWRDIYDRVSQHSPPSSHLHLFPSRPCASIPSHSPPPMRKEFEDGFGSVTAMLVSQLKSTKYYFAFDRAFEIMKQQVRQRHMVWNGYEQAVPLSHTAVHQVEHAETAEEAWKAIGQDYWVVTPCYSTARPGVVMNGTRLTMVKTPTYYEFSIKTPVVPTRWDEYDFEMETAWKDLCEGYLDDSLKASDVDAYRRRIHHAILRMGFYWYNFMPMARGTAMVGYVSMLGLFAAADMHVTADIPKGAQVDWEGILTPRAEDFIASLSEWMLPSIDYSSPVFTNLAHITVADALPTLLDVINALSFHEEDKNIV